MASMTDLFTAVENGGVPIATTAVNPRAPGNTTLVAVSLARWPTTGAAGADSAVYFITSVEKTNVNTGEQELDETKLMLIKGIVSGSSIVNLNVIWSASGSDMGNAVGDVIMMAPSSSWAQALFEGLSKEHSLDGTHNNITANGLSINPGGAVDMSLADSVNYKPASVVSNALAPAAVKASNVDFATFKRPAYGLINVTATGHLSITGVGFKPNSVRFDMLGDRGLGPSSGDTATGFGVMTPTQQFTQTTHSTASASVAYASNSNCISGLHFNSTTPELLAQYVSMDNDGFTINVSATNISAGTGYWIMWTAY